jgi:hypothetical protein
MIPKCASPQESSSLSSEEDTTTNYTIQNLQSRLNHLYNLLVEPPTIHLRGYEFLRLKSVTHDIKQGVNTLFFEAHVPSNWKLNIRWTYSSHTKIDVHITLLNYYVKERVKELLRNYFLNTYNSIIYVD